MENNTKPAFGILERFMLQVSKNTCTSGLINGQDAVIQPGIKTDVNVLFHFRANAII